MSKLHVKTGDTVKILAGYDEDVGHVGKIIAVYPDKERVTVEGVKKINIRHRKPRGQQDQGGRIELPAPIHVSNVMLVCPKCRQATRVSRAVANGKKVRVCKKCGANID